MNIIERILVLTAILIPQIANAADSISGTVAETIEVGTYIYIRLEEDDTWLASSPVEVQVGDRIEFTGGAPMKDFYSPKLDRTFPDILFVSRLEVTESKSTTGHHSDQVAGGPHGQISEPSVAPPGPGEISPPEGGMTIQQITAADPSLEGKRVTVHARVMKVSVGILGKNWVTLQDGTGSAPNDRLIATSAELVDVGDTVTAIGIIRHDIEIGAGYSYDVLLENATFSK